MIADTPTGQSCGTCRFWAGRPDGQQHKRGSPFPCRRHAPLPLHGGGHGFATASTPAHWWCGEWRALDTTETSR